MDPKNKRKPAPAGGQPTSAPTNVETATLPAAVTPPVDTTPRAEPSPLADAAAPADAAAFAEAPAAAQPEPAPQPDPETDPAPTAEAEIIDARVLVAFDEYEADDIISAPSDAIEQLKIAGRVDPHPDAVAFAKSLLDA